MFHNRAVVRHLLYPPVIFFYDGGMNPLLSRNVPTVGIGRPTVATLVGTIVGGTAANITIIPHDRHAETVWTSEFDGV